jgi:hypothetical protein
VEQQMAGCRLQHPAGHFGGNCISLDEYILLKLKQTIRLASMKTVINPTSIQPLYFKPTDKIKPAFHFSLLTFTMLFVFFSYFMVILKKASFSTSLSHKFWH